MRLEDLAGVAAQMSRNYQMDAILAGKAGTVFIVNSECTVLLRYTGVADVGPEVRWKACDWEKGTARMEGDEVVFSSESGGCKRTKRCSAPAATFAQLEKAWTDLRAKAPDGSPSLTMTAALAGVHLEEGLSHVEFWYEDNTPVLKQRDLYSGTLITVELPSSKRQSGGFFSAKPQPFDRTAIRTKDLQALLFLEGSLDFSFGPEASIIKSTTFEALLSNCIYDGLYTVEELTDGRKIKENGTGEQEPNPEAEGAEGGEADNLN